MRAIVAAVACVMLLFNATAYAEKNESTVGLSGGVLLPAFDPQSALSPALVTWGLGIAGQYGLTDNLYLQGSFLWSTFAGKVGHKTMYQDGRPYAGTFLFNGAFYHPEFGLRYKVFGGYNLAPYVEAQIGYLWATYQSGTMQGASKAAPSVSIDGFAEGTMTASAGFALDYRLFNTLLVGLGLRYIYPLQNGIAQHYLTAPVSVSFYW